MTASIADLTGARLREHLGGEGLRFHIGPFLYQLHSEWLDIAAWLERLYAVYPLAAPQDCADFRVELFWRGWRKRQLGVRFDGEILPYPLFGSDYAAPHMEWGLNWGVAMHAHWLLMLHSGVVERGGRALMLPGQPGSGKSTLSAALGWRGWRFMSDEFCLIRPQTFDVVPFPRLVPLKNAAIEVMAAFAPQAQIGPEFPETHKGRLAHMRPPAEAVAAMAQPAKPGWFVFPRFVAGTSARLQPVAPDLCFARLATNAFNYEVRGRTGFDTLYRLVSECPAFALEFGDLDAAIAVLDELPARD